jgi:hypothetical protein
MIAYYASGEKPIPKPVLLATEGHRARERAVRNGTIHFHFVGK